MRRAAALLAALGLAAALGGASAAKPRRIVSVNLCADQLVLLLVERERIASVSHLAANPAVSALADRAAGLPPNHGHAEEILPHRPDLVVAGFLTATSAVHLLRRLGIPVVALDVARTLADVRANLRRAARLVGERARGERLVAAFDRRLAAAGRPPTGGPGRPRPLAALYRANGYSPGAGTLADAVVAAAGLDNLARRMGRSGTSHLPLELLVAGRPDLLVVGGGGSGAGDGGDPSRAAALLRHSALRRAFAGRPIVEIPDRLWACGTPAVARAVELLAAARRRLGA